MRYKLGIRFSDNDFGTTFRTLLALMAKNNDYSLEKPILVVMFNKALPGIYWIAQNRYRYSTDWDPTSYLKLEEKNIYLNVEVDEFLTKYSGEGYNSEFHVLDTTGHTPYIFSF